MLDEKWHLDCHLKCGTEKREGKVDKNEVQGNEGAVEVEEMKTAIRKLMRGRQECGAYKQKRCKWEVPQLQWMIELLMWCGEVVRVS